MNHAEQQGLFLAIVQILRENQLFSKQSIKMHFASYFYGFVVYFDASGKKESWLKTQRQSDVEDTLSIPIKGSVPEQCDDVQSNKEVQHKDDLRGYIYVYLSADSVRILIF